MAKLLLIEDEKILRENTCELLEAYGYECLTAENGAEGLEKALSEKPDLIICDIMLPLLNGYEIKGRLNQNTELEQTPFIFLSAKVERSDLRQGMDLGAADYITKPFKICELVNSIESRLEQSKNTHSIADARFIRSIIDFIHIAKHECNTPLHGIITLSDILTADQPVQADFSHKASRAINTSGKRLHKTLNNLLDLIRLRHYTVSADQGQVIPCFKNTIRRILAERSKYYKFSGEIKADLSCYDAIRLSPEDLEVIIFETLDNMFKFSSSGAVAIELTTTGEGSNQQMVLSATNSICGPVGFCKKDIGAFKQYNSGKLDKQGSGLGLCLIQLITEKYQGEIELDQSDINQFRLILTFPFIPGPATLTGPLNLPF